MATRGANKALPPRETPASPVMNDAIARKQEKTEQDLVEVKVSQEALRSAHGELAANVIDIKASHQELAASQQELAAALKAVTGQLMDAMELLKQGQGAVGTGN